MRLPYKSVTGRHTYVIYLMLFNIHAYLGFMQFIKFSVWPAEKGKTEADVSLLPHLNVHRAPAKEWNCLENASVATIESLPWPSPFLSPQETCP